MLRLLILCLVLSTAAVTSEEVEDQNSGDGGDDEDGLTEIEEIVPVQHVPNNFAETNMIPEKAQANDEKDGVTTSIIIAVVCVVALAAITIAAVILVRRRMLKPRQGVYSVPVEQSEKPTI